MSHIHFCVNCGLPVTCDGPMIENYDGLPSVVCETEIYPQVDPLCERCSEFPNCEWCGRVYELDNSRAFHSHRFCSLACEIEAIETESM